MRTFSAKIIEELPAIGYICLAEYPNYFNQNSFDKTFVHDFLESEYSVYNVEEYRKTDYLPFPFIANNLVKEDIIEINSDIYKFLIKRFTLYGNKCENKELFNEELKEFETDIQTVKERIPELNRRYPIFILSIDSFDTKSKKVHGLLNDMGHIYGYYFFIIFLNSKNELRTLELSFD